MSILKHYKKTGYVQISNILAQNTSLSYEALGLLVNLLSRPDDWVVHKSYFRIESCGEVKLNRIFKELQDAGYLHLSDIRENNKIIDRYWTVSDEPIQSREKWEEILQNLNPTKPHDKETSSCAPPELQKKDLIQKKEKYTNTCSSTQKELDERNSSFEIFWNLYPRKVAKKDATKAWDKYYKKADIILNDIKLRMAGDEWRDKKFIPYPASYLNGERWNDDPKDKFVDKTKTAKSWWMEGVL